MLFSNFFLFSSFSFNKTAIQELKYIMFLVYNGEPFPSASFQVKFKTTWSQRLPLNVTTDSTFTSTNCSLFFFFAVSMSKYLTEMEHRSSFDRVVLQISTLARF